MTAILTPHQAPLVAPSIHRLANGVTIVAEQIPVDAVNLNVWVNVGSSVESDDANGMAHFLEHMMFKGTERQKVGEFEKAVEACGGNTNAGTSQDYTHYYITVAPDDFAQLAPLQIDLVLNASIPDAEFQRERLVVLEEIRRSEDNPDRRVYRHITEMVHKDLPYRRPVLGTEEVIAGLTSEQMRSFHRRWYAPQNMTVVVVGNLPVTETIATIARSFEQTSPSSNVCDRKSWQSEPPFDAIVRQEITDRRLHRARLVMTWRVPGLTELEETYPLNVLASILSGGRTSRLVKDLRESRGLVDRISASNMTQAWQGTFQILAHLPVENIAAAELAIREHLSQLQDEAIASEEIEKIRTQVANRFVFANEAPKDRAGIYGYYHRIAGDLDAALNYPDIIKSISASDLQIAARQYLNPDAYGILTVKPA